MDLSALSRAVSHALRHEPWLYELELDDAGWVPVEALLSALRRADQNWSALTRADLVAMLQTAQKQRHEMQGDRIRALYGHSTPERLLKQPAPPPDLLYHGTDPAVLDIILREGLRPMQRHYVHLSCDTETATEVGRRKASQPAILTIRAADAHGAGHRFYRGNDRVWLADAVPAQFISR